jgi:hypothetical protein
MTDRSDEWWAGKTLADRAKKLTDDGKAVVVHVKGVKEPLVVGEVEIESFAVTFRSPADLQGGRRTYHIAKAALILVEEPIG